MRTAGTVFIALAVLVVAGFWLVPAEFNVFGTSVSCGIPITHTSPDDLSGNDIDQAVLNECGSRSTQRVVIGLVLGIIAAVAGLLMLRAADTADDNAVRSSGGTVTAAPRSSAGRWLGRIAVKVVALFAAVTLLVVLLAVL